MAHGTLRTLAQHIPVGIAGSELCGTFKRDTGDIIENTVVCLGGRVSFTLNTD